MRRLEEQADNMRRLEIASGPRREKEKERERRLEEQADSMRRLDGSKRTH